MRIGVAISLAAQRARAIVGLALGAAGAILIPRRWSDAGSWQDNQTWKDAA
ncbi:hypothetical protein [Sphingomonas sp. MA1305]|uniref:hypothetical protein n=1 Tax=Sphingomonas sp. MA1305 TaxID=2479204 RepID=UPI0018DFDB45|nr:hypothetical protein [Sphingomonas sp. MA1305]